MAEERSSAGLNDCGPIALGISRWDDHYDSPNGDLVLVSREKVGFRVDAWTLAKKSAFVKDLLDVPSAERLNTAPILLDENEAAIRYFLDIALSGGTPVAKLDLQRCGEIYSLCERFQATPVLSSISEAMQIALRDTNSDNFDAWAVFKLAAKLDDVPLAKEAIRRLDPCKRNAVSLFFNIESLDIYDEVPKRFTLALIRSTSKWATGCEKDYNPMDRQYMANKASEMADAFDLH